MSPAVTPTDERLIFAPDVPTVKPVTMSFVPSVSFASAAVPEAAAVLGQSIQQMTLTDAKTILTGTNNKNAARQIAAIDGILKKFPKATESTAEAPGPPGFISSTPMRWPLAGMRTTARFACAPTGSAASTGTGTVVHWAVGR